MTNYDLSDSRERLGTQGGADYDLCDSRERLAREGLLWEGLPRAC